RPPRRAPRGTPWPRSRRSRRRRLWPGAPRSPRRGRCPESGFVQSSVLKVATAHAAPSEIVSRRDSARVKSRAGDGICRSTIFSGIRVALLVPQKWCPNAPSLCLGNKAGPAARPGELRLLLRRSPRIGRNTRVVHALGEAPRISGLRLLYRGEEERVGTTNPLEVFRSRFAALSN